VRILDAVRDDDAILSRRKLHAKAATFRMPLIDATVRAIVGAEVRPGRVAERVELHLARQRTAVFVADVEGHRRGARQGRVERDAPAGVMVTGFATGARPSSRMIAL
jgi:hypothetical protein